MRQIDDKSVSITYISVACLDLDRGLLGELTRGGAFDFHKSLSYLEVSLLNLSVCEPWHGSKLPGGCGASV